MKTFTMQIIKNSIGKFDSTKKTGDKFLDDRYEEQISIVGHDVPYYRFFYLLAEQLKPSLVVELGSWQGTAAAHFASAVSGCNVITIDIHKDDKNAQQRTREAEERYPNLTYLNQWTWDAVNDVKDAGAIDILFIDSWHEYQYLKRDFDDYFPLLADNSLIIFDDVYNTDSFKDMEKFWEELEGTKHLNVGLHGSVPMGFLKVSKGKKIEPAKSKRTGKSSTKKTDGADTKAARTPKSSTNPKGKLSQLSFRNLDSD